MNLIEGLKLDVTAVEMREHALRRAEHHKGRAELYESKMKEIEDLQKSADDSQRQISKVSNSNTNPVDSLETSAKNHRRKERFFRFSAEHFVEGSVYRLDIQELAHFEFAPDMRY